MKNIFLTLCLLSFLVACQEPAKTEKKETVSQEAAASTDTVRELLIEGKAGISVVKTDTVKTSVTAEPMPAPSKKEAITESKAKTEVKKPTPPPTKAKPEAVVAAPTFEEVKPILQKYTCMVCHSVDKKLVGPPYKEVAKKGYSNEKIVQLIAKPEPGNWPAYPPMAALPQVPKADALKMAAWINSLK